MQHVARGASTNRVRRHVLHNVVLGTERLNVFGEMIVSPQIVVKDGPHLLAVRLANVQETCRMSDVYKVRNATQNEDGHIGSIRATQMREDGARLLKLKKNRHVSLETGCSSDRGANKLKGGVLLFCPCESLSRDCVSVRTDHVRSSLTCAAHCDAEA